MLPCVSWPIKQCAQGLLTVPWVAGSCCIVPMRLTVKYRTKCDSLTSTLRRCSAAHSSFFFFLYTFLGSIMLLYHPVDQRGSGTTLVHGPSALCIAVVASDHDV